MDGLDEIRLTGLKVFGHHGVYPQERREGQWFLVDFAVRLDTRRAARTDDVADTVHYGELAERVAAIVSGEPVDLIETLAARIADALLAPTLVQAAEVTVHKPDAPIEQPFADVTVTIRRTRGDADTRGAL
ncbi:dihydroneopterin aldolase [Microbacterium sp. BWT-B31]|uniref:dihydroneopterin aldolase n=1 Tax=Microbacterium sp. BWT-B31 TaxID=3232072 RepID=UPI0035294EAA